MKKVTNKVTFTWGLPGSGKTTFCEKAVATTNRRGHTHTISHDDPSYKNKNDRFVARVADYLQYSIEHLLVDTLITTNEGFANLVNQLDLSKVQEVEIQYWVPNIENCLWNDRYRREVSSEITIKNTVVEEPNIKRIEELCPKLGTINITVVKNRVERREAWKVFADQHQISHRNGLVKSYSWSLGGTSGNCWNDHISTISGDTPPTAFKEFDDILMRIVPNLGFLQYKKIYNECVTTDTQSEGDYYGGSTTDAWYQFNIETLYRELMALDLITTPE